MQLNIIFPPGNTENHVVLKKSSRKIQENRVKSKVIGLNYTLKQKRPENIMKYFDFKRENLNSNTKENRNGRLKVFDINLQNLYCMKII